MQQTRLPCFATHEEGAKHKLRPTQTSEGKGVRRQQESQVERCELRTKDRAFNPGETTSTDQKWVPATVIAQTGPATPTDPPVVRFSGLLFIMGAI